MPAKRQFGRVLRPRQRNVRRRANSAADTHEQPEPADLIAQEPDHNLDLPAAMNYRPQTFVEQSDIGQLNKICTHCGAHMFQHESKGFCCNSGKVSLEKYPPPPDDISQLYHDAHFLNNIKRYNTAFQMTSFGCKEVCQPGWNPTFQLQGQLYHLHGSLLPPSGQAAQFIQIYFLDPDQQLNTRLSLMDGLDPGIVARLQNCFNEHNTYIREFHTITEFIQEHGNVPDVALVLKAHDHPRGEHERRFNLPVTNEVAILMPNEAAGDRDIVLRLKDNSLRRISALHQSYDPLQYPVLFPYGTHGWNLQLKIQHKVTQLQFYNYQLMIRPNCYILKSRKLFQQFLVDVYCKIESERLFYLRREQSKLRADSYMSLHDELHAAADSRNLGQRIVLPSTFTGGPRYMFERQQDAMSYVRKYGRPHLFITMTTNPKWKEIMENLTNGEQPHDRPDLIVRVFRQKLMILMNHLKAGAFGNLQAWLYSIEFQKRGLPHAHILIWLTTTIRPEMINFAVSAEIPDETADPELHRMVTTHMIYGPCGQYNPTAVCMKQGKCSKHFPKQSLPETEVGNNGYPLYRRRSPDDGGHHFIKMVKDTQVTVNNQWVVPYNKWLLRQMNCHINVEICTSVKSIKYVLKYVHKGSDQSVFQLQGDSDEISEYLNARYIGSTEAAWRIFEMPINERFPPVVHLAVHLENGQRVIFTTTNVRERVANGPPPTTLTAFFELCARDEFARQQLYEDIPKFYTWNATNKTWNKRKRGQPVPDSDTKEAQVVGRIYTINPRQGECYYLRTLLLHCRGPTSFQDLRTVNGVVWQTYRDACLRRGLLEDDTIHTETLREAAVSAMPRSLRQLFCVILIYCEPGSPADLWAEHKFSLSEDFSLTMEQHDAENAALISIEDYVDAMGGKRLHEYGLPAPIRAANERQGSDYQRHVSFDVEDMNSFVQENKPKLTEEQRTFYDTFLEAVNNGSSNIYFLDAPGGCGKTFLIQLILAAIRGSAKIAVATATSGLAATQLDGGRTVHSTFKVPLNAPLQETPLCSIKKQSSLARLLQDCSAVIVDEAPMLHRACFEAIDRTLRDIRDSDTPMGGLPFLLCGDFRQILPVVPSGTRGNIVNATIKKSYLWEHIHKFSLTRNMRAVLSNDQAAQGFSNLLLDVGNGTFPHTGLPYPDSISLTETFTVVKDLRELMLNVFPDFPTNHTNIPWISQRAILCTTNEHVSKINKLFLDQMPSEGMVYTSINTALTPEEAATYPQEFLNSIELSGLPQHQLHLKEGVPVIILRSINPPQLMNGVRCVVKELMRHSITVEITVGPYKGNIHYIPRITLEPSDSNLPFTFKRKQFPNFPCFGITFNKSQGQTLKCVGLHLPESVFSHGMLYVGLSRVGSKDSIFINCSNGITRNIVYTEVLH